MTDTRYPAVEVRLTDQDGNALAIISRTVLALRAAGVPREETNRYVDEAISDDYDNVLATTSRWVVVS
jgi:hypothetical protein